MMLAVVAEDHDRHLACDTPVHSRPVAGPVALDLTACSPFTYVSNQWCEKVRGPRKKISGKVFPICCWSQSSAAQKFGAVPATNG